MPDTFKILIGDVYEPPSVDYISAYSVAGSWADVEDIRPVHSPEAQLRWPGLIWRSDTGDVLNSTKIDCIMRTRDTIVAPIRPINALIPSTSTSKSFNNVFCCLFLSLSPHAQDLVASKRYYDATINSRADVIAYVIELVTTVFKTGIASDVVKTKIAAEEYILEHDDAIGIEYTAELHELLRRVRESIGDTRGPLTTLQRAEIDHHCSHYLDEVAKTKPVLYSLWKDSQSYRIYHTCIFYSKYSQYTKPVRKQNVKLVDTLPTVRTAAQQISFAQPTGPLHARGGSGRPTHLGRTLPSTVPSPSGRGRSAPAARRRGQ
jgi:hypothetical protein